MKCVYCGLLKCLNNLKKDIFSSSKMSMIPLFFYTNKQLNSFNSLKMYIFHLKKEKNSDSKLKYDSKKIDKEKLTEILE